MKKIACIFLAISIAPLCFAAGADSIMTAISDSLENGEAKISFRYRLETVEQDTALGLLDDATLHSVRTRLNFKTKEHNGFNLFVELDDVTYLSNEEANNLRNGKNTYAVIADPDGTGINQLHIDYKADDLLVRLGRQRINLDNQRFVGGVGWRQNEQTFDALSFVYTGVDDLTVTAAYVRKISRIFGPEDGNPAKNLDARTLLLNGHYKVAGIGNFTAYYYDFDIEDAPAASNSTLGLRYTNTFEAGDLKIPVTVEFATQDDSGDNLNSYSATYTLLEAGVDTEWVNARVGIESLGGDNTGGSGFITPLATLHKFQGWADRFLDTPSIGIEDTYISLSRDFEGHKFGLTYHTFESEESLAGLGTLDYGTEIDFSYSTKLTKNLSLLVKYAAFSSDIPADDTTKLWAMLTATF